jgi:hypothetical protein
MAPFIRRDAVSALLRENVMPCRLVVTDPANFLEARFWIASGLPTHIDDRFLKKTAPKLPDLPDSF